MVYKPKPGWLTSHNIKPPPIFISKRHEHHFDDFDDFVRPVRFRQYAREVSYERLKLKRG